MKTQDQYVGHGYHILEGISSVYDGLDMSDVLLISCQHLLSPQLAMYRSFFGAGLKPENCLIAGKNYSTNAQVVAELRKARCPVAPLSDQFEQNMYFDQWFAPRVQKWLKDILVERNLNKIRRIIVLDDGGHMHGAAQNILGNDPRLAGVEQTSSGQHRIKRLGIKFNRHMVASTRLKQREEARFIGALGAQRIVEHLERRGKNKDSARVLVIGMGTIGRNTAAQLYLIHEMDVKVTDVRYHDRDSADMRADAANLMFGSRGRLLEYADAMLGLSEFDVIVGATGASALTPQQIVQHAHPQASFISMSSGDSEFPALMFRNPTGCRVHDDCWVGNRCLVNSGFPITFYGNAHELHPLQIELTIAQLQTSVMDLALSSQTSSDAPSLCVVINRAYELWKWLLEDEKLVAA